MSLVTHQLKIYGSVFSAEPCEIRSVPDGVILGEWLDDNVAGFDPLNTELSFNLAFDEPVTFDIECHLTPKKIPSIVKDLTFGFLERKLWKSLTKKPARVNQRGQSNNLEMASAGGQTVKYGEPVREAFGRNKITPDYLVPPRRYFENKKTHWMETLLCVGVGDFVIDADGPLVANSQINQLGGGNRATIYSAGASLATEPAAVWWHTSREVGPTAMGGSGLPLESIKVDDRLAPAGSYLFSGKTITAQGTQQFPTSWEAGNNLTFEIYQDYTIEQYRGPDIYPPNAPSYPGPVEGSFLIGKFSGLDFAVNDKMLIQGFSGEYTVKSVESLAGGNFKIKTQGFIVSQTSGNFSVKRKGDLYAIVANNLTSITVQKVNAVGAPITWAGWQSAITATNSTIQIDPNSVTSLWTGIFSATPANELCAAIEVDLFFPQGLIAYDQNNNPLTHSAGFTFEYREKSAHSWQSFTKVYTEAEKDQIGFTETIVINPPSRIKECRLRRTGAESIKQNEIDKMQWFGLRAKMARQKFNYENMTTMAVKLNADSTSADSDSQVSVVATRKINGAATRSVVDAAKYILKDSQINETDFNSMNSVLNARSDTFDFQFNALTTVKSAASTALSVGFSDFTIKNALVSPVRDVKKDPALLYAFNHTYSAQNTTAKITTQIEMPDPDEIDGYDVEYIDSQSWKVETVRCQQPGSLGVRVSKLKADGITSRTKAYQWGMRQLMSKILDTMTISTKTELDAKNSDYGDYVNFVQEVPDWSQSALVESVAGLVITSTEPLNWVAGAQHVVALQLPTGRMSEIKPATQVDDYNLRITAPFSFTPTPHNTALFFGVKGRFATPAIVREVKLGGNSATISADVYNDDKYKYDNAEAPQ